MTYVHTVMWTRAVMSPPALLDTSEVEMSSLSSPIVEKEPGTAWRRATEKGWRANQCSNTTTAWLQPAWTIQQQAASGLSKKSDAEPKKKMRKTTNVKKMENAMKPLYEKFSAQQEKAMKEARKMEARRIELEERQAQREERDTVYDVVARNVQYQA